MSTPENTTPLDFGPVTAALAGVVRGVQDTQLPEPTPCTDWTVADLLQHLDGLCVAFAHAARKETRADGEPPAVDGSRLEGNWREAIPARLAELAQAWADPAAWTGETAAGGLELDGATAGLIALDELVVHGWDLARATGQDFDPDEASIAGARSFAATFCGPDVPPEGRGPYGPEVPAPTDASPLEELLAMTGRDPRATVG